MVEKIGKDNVIKSKEVLRAIEEKFQCSFEWMIYPVITKKEYPKYTVFCQFNRVISKPGYRPFKRTYSLRLDWGRMESNADPFERPHDLLLLQINELKEGSEELKNQLNLSYNN